MDALLEKHFQRRGRLQAQPVRPVASACRAWAGSHRCSVVWRVRSLGCLTAGETGATRTATWRASFLATILDTRSLQSYLGHRNIRHTVRYTELAPQPFKNFWRTSDPPGEWRAGSKPAIPCSTSRSAVSLDEPAVINHQTADRAQGLFDRARAALNDRSHNGSPRSSRLRRIAQSKASKGTSRATSARYLCRSPPALNDRAAGSFARTSRPAMVLA